jgi:Flp pilus assembly protein TadG
MAAGLVDRWLPARALSLAQRWRRDEGGATAVEFAIVALPFMLLLFGIMTVCLYFFTNFSLENAAWQAARAVRTGQMQQSQGTYAGTVTLEDRKTAFRAALCAKAPTFLSCASKVVVIVQSNAGFGGIVKPACASNGTLINQTAAGFDTGAASSVVLITVCYPWSFANKLPFLKFGNLNDGSMLMQASVAFRTEPYN